MAFESGKTILDNDHPSCLSFARFFSYVVRIHSIMCPAKKDLEYESGRERLHISEWINTTLVRVSYCIVLIHSSMVQKLTISLGISEEYL